MKNLESILRKSQNWKTLMGKIFSICMKRAENLICRSCKLGSMVVRIVVSFVDMLSCVYRIYKRFPAPSNISLLLHRISYIVHDKYERSAPETLADACWFVKSSETQFESQDFSISLTMACEQLVLWEIFVCVVTQGFFILNHQFCLLSQTDWGFSSSSENMIDTLWEMWEMWIVV